MINNQLVDELRRRMAAARHAYLLATGDAGERDGDCEMGAALTMLAGTLGHDDPVVAAVARELLSPADPDAAEYAIVELFGHVRTAGRTSEVERYGGKMMRLDIPNPDGSAFATQYLSHGALYRVTPTSESTARRVAAMCRPAPVKPWELPALPAAGDDDTWDGRDD